MSKLYRTLHPEVRVVDAKRGLVDYVASDETIDAYREIIRAKGWRFTHFRKNAPFVDSHDYHTIDKQLGRVTEWTVKGDQLIERVQWAVDVPENKLATLGFRMTEAGYLKAVSVGFWPKRALSRYCEDKTDFYKEAKEMGLSMEEADQVHRIFIEQEQVELSACVLGANPNALAKAFKADVLTEEDMDYVGRMAEEEHDYLRNRNTLSTASLPEDDTLEAATRQPSPAAAAKAKLQRERDEWLRKFKVLTNQN